jgi:hypothetical protein
MIPSIRIPDVASQSKRPASTIGGWLQHVRRGNQIPKCSRQLSGPRGYRGRRGPIKSASAIRGRVDQSGIGTLWESTELETGGRRGSCDIAGDGTTERENLGLLARVVTQSDPPPQSALHWASTPRGAFRRPPQSACFQAEPITTPEPQRDCSDDHSPLITLTATP